MAKNIYYRVCPKCHYQRQKTDNTALDICPRCGLQFSKWLQHQLQVDKVDVPVTTTSSQGLTQKLFDTLLYVPDKIDTLDFYGRVSVWLVLVLWGSYFILLDLETNIIGYSFMHRVNLIFHEAGHVIFAPFGWFMMVLGGSLLQLLMPLIVILTLVLKNRDNFAASVGLWWLAQSMMDLAPYINDARALELQLLGGGTGADRPGGHDWENILGYLDMLEFDHFFANIMDITGNLLMISSFVWGVYILRLQYMNK